MEEAQCIKSCLLIYERATGQQVNFQKSSVHFSRNIHNSQANEISQFLQVQISDDNFVYLGLPSYVGRNKEKFFAM